MDQTQNQTLPLDTTVKNKQEEHKQVNDVLHELDSELFSISESAKPADVTPHAVSGHPDADAHDHKYAVVLSILHEMRDNIRSAIELLEGTRVAPRSIDHHHHDPTASFISANVVEGVFNGQHMIGTDGKEYTVPANYASKSKLVEGDVLKLTITAEGKFIYKQIKPIERKRVIGTLKQDAETHQYRTAVEGKEWHVLTASVTYYKGSEGDEVVLLVPEIGESFWGAVENIMKKESGTSL